MKAEFTDDSLIKELRLQSNVSCKELARQTGVKTKRLLKLRQLLWDHENPTYFITDNVGHVKIGFSKHIDERIVQMQVSSPHELTLLGKTSVPEDILHTKFSQHHIRGEWFALSDEIKEWVVDNCTLNTGE